MESIRKIIQSNKNLKQGIRFTLIVSMAAKNRILVKKKYLMNIKMTFIIVAWFIIRYNHQLRLNKGIYIN